MKLLGWRWRTAEIRYALCIGLFCGFLVGMPTGALVAYSEWRGQVEQLSDRVVEYEAPRPAPRRSPVRILGRVTGIDTIGLPEGAFLGLDENAAGSLRVLTDAEVMEALDLQEEDEPGRWLLEGR